MKNIFLIILISSLSFLLTGCSEMEDSYAEYVVPGGIVYPGIATESVVYPGHNRVQISWIRNVDPSVTRAVVFWNNMNDSVPVAMPTGADTIRVIIDDLPENTYTFFIRTYDSQGNTSIPVENFGVVYGDSYLSTLSNRPIAYTVMNESGQVFIEWKEPDLTKGAIGMEVQYTDKDNQEHINFFDVSDEVSFLENYDASTTFNYRTLYLPDSLCIDTFYTVFQQNPQEYFLLEKKNWSVVDFSTQHPGGANLASNVIDGNPDTRWHTHASGSTYPHFVSVDMGVKATVTGFELFRKENDARACDKFKLFISNDNETWEDLGEFDFDRFSNEGQFYEISSQAQAQFFKFVGVEGPEKYMVTGEINVYGFVN